MEFVFNIRNFEPDEGLKEHFNKRIRGLNTVLKVFGHFEKKGEILIDKLPKGQFLARINLHLPKHHIEAEETGYSPLEAIHDAVDNAKAQVIKIKERNLSFHKRKAVLTKNNFEATPT